MSVDYKPLDRFFMDDGFCMAMVLRQGDVALFAKTKVAWTRVFYEVVIIQKCPETKWPDGTSTPARERMPKPNQWGQQGWTPANWLSAITMFKGLASQKHGVGKLLQFFFNDWIHDEPTAEQVWTGFKNANITFRQAILGEE